MAKTRTKKPTTSSLSDLTAEQLFEETGLLTRSLSVRAVGDGDDRSIEVVASTNALDSHGEIVEQDWDLARYKANPVVLYNHNRLFQADTLPIGRAEDVAVKDDALEMRIVFASAEANPMAERVLRLFREKVLRAVSVGFSPGDIREEKRDGVPVTVLSQNVLYELSVTPVGANPDALAKALAKLKARAEGDKASVQSQADITPPREKNMDMEKQVAELTKSLDDEKKKSGALDQRCVALEASLAAEKARANGLAREKLEKRLDALVGKKIAPAEKATLIDLADKAPDVFEKHLAAISERPDMGLLSTIVPGAAKAEESQANTQDNGASFDAIVRQRAFGG